MSTCQFELILLGEMFPFMVRLNLVESVSRRIEMFSLAVPQRFSGFCFMRMKARNVILCGSNSYESSLLRLRCSVIRSLSRWLLALLMSDLFVVRSLGNSLNISLRVARDDSLFSDWSAYCG